MAKSNISIDVGELVGLVKSIRDASTKTLELLDRAINEHALLVDRKAKEKVQKGSRSGTRYRRGGKVAYRSAPGEPAKTDTGRLVSSIRADLSGYMTAEVGSLHSIAPYGEYLEDPDKMNRPWLAPTFDENKDKLQSKIGSAIRDGGLAS